MKKLYAFLLSILYGLTFAYSQCNIAVSSAPSSTFCYGQCVTMHATGANTYLWTPGAMTDSVVIECPSTTTVYTVNGTDLSSNTCSTTATITVVPRDDASFGYADQILCQVNSGFDPSEIAIITGGSTGTFTATPAGMVINANTGQIDVNASAANTYTITFTTNGICPSSSSTTITINASPVAVQPSNISFCNGGTVAPITLSSSPSGATFTWTNSNTAIGLAASGSGNIPSFTAVNTTSAAITTYVYIVPTLNGCQGATKAFSITVKPTPIVTVPLNIVTCRGGLVAQTNFVTTPAGGTVTWTNSNTAIGLAASGSGSIPAFSATNSSGSPITSTITVTPTVSGCLGTPSTYTITVNPLQNVSASASPSTICSGQSTTLTGSGAGSYYWVPGNISGSPINVNPAITTTYYVTGVTSGYTCTNSVNVTVNPVAAITFTPANPSVCPGSCIAITAHSNIPGSTFIWFPGALSGSPVTVCPATTTTYTVATSAPSGCTNSTSIAVTVNPTFSFHILPSDTTILSGQSVPLNIPETGSFTWIPATGLNTTSGSHVIASPSTTTTYTVMGINSNGCSGSTNATVHINNKFIHDVSGSSPCHLPYLAILKISDYLVLPNDTINYYLNFGDGNDTIFNLIFQNNPSPEANITHAYLSIGTYSPSVILQHTNGFADTIYSQNLIIASDTCGNISGNVYIDENIDCNFEHGEFLLGNTLIKLFNQSHVLVQAQFTDSYGFYSFYVPNGNYKIEIDSNIFSSYAMVCPAGSSYTVSTLPSTDKNFGVINRPGFDLYCIFTSGGTFRPGSISHFNFSVGNLDSVSTDALVKLYLDPLTTFTSASIAPSSINGDTISWFLTDLKNPGNSLKNFYILLHDSPDLVVGDSVSFCLGVTPLYNDMNPLNNNSCRKFVSTNSYDPNYKEVVPAGNITASSVLNYTIHFQNTGTTEADNIYILDTLNEHLDLITLQIVASSHPLSVEILNHNQKNILKFLFANIMLPDSGSNQSLSNGFVSYKIRPLQNTPEGTVIKNGADIYFDYNDGVATNIVQSEIPLILGIQSENNINIPDKVMPNPVNQQATLTYYILEQSKAAIKLFDITGKEIMMLLNQELAIGEHTLTFDCNDLKSGIYFIRINSDNYSSVLKLVKL
jgi:hypothetical protein